MRFLLLGLLLFAGCSTMSMEDRCVKEGGYIVTVGGLIVDGKSSGVKHFCLKPMKN